MLSAAHRAARILAIEDDLLLASHPHAHLQDSGYRVTLCHDGSEGLGLAERGYFRRKLQALGDTGLHLQTLWGKGYLLGRQKA